VRLVPASRAIESRVIGLTLFSDGIRYAISGEVGFHVKGAAGETVKFDLVASEVVPGESHNPAVATSSDSTTFHVHITPEVAQAFATHMKFRCSRFLFAAMNATQILQAARL
jgi:predicted naringenin-chalcone synthase